MSRLADNVEALMNRQLTTEEVNNLAKFQRINDINDDDPLIVVLALMAKDQLLFEAIPNLLQQKANETIALHEQTLRSQSVLIAKELLTTIAENITAELKRHDVGWKMQWVPYTAFFVAGAVFAGFLLRYFH